MGVVGIPAGGVRSSVELSWVASPDARTSRPVASNVGSGWGRNWVCSGCRNLSLWGEHGSAQQT